MWPILQDLTAALRAEILRGPQAAWADDILAVAKPAVAVDLKRLEAPMTAGGSFVSGVPTLPRDMGWPLGRDGKPLGFLAQIDLADVPRFVDWPLPEDGHLFFFVGENDDAGNIEHKIRYCRSEAWQLRPQSPPIGAQRRFCYLEPWPCALTFAPRLALPTTSPSPDGHPDLCAFEDEVFRLWELGPFRTNASRMFGPCESWSDSREDAVMHNLGYGDFVHRARRSLEWYDEDVLKTRELGLFDYADRLASLRPLFVEFIAQREALWAAARTDWTVLFAFGSHQVEGKDFYSLWHDAKRIQFVGSVHELRRGDFSRTYCCISV